jgi:hypothetical protein
MILKAADANPSLVREAFLELFDESTDLEARIKTFRKRIKPLIAQTSPGKKDFQDQRAVLVYLTLRYPDDYCFYKFRMFEHFCEKIGHDYQPKKGNFANIEAYFDVCDYLKTILVADDSLMQLHRAQLTADDYLDPSFNILTQDFVYAVQSYLSVPEDEPLNATTPETYDLTMPPASDKAGSEQAGRIETTAYRILRDTKIAKGIKRLYDYRCQLCDETIVLNDRLYSEAHHIRPLGRPHNGPDVDSNIINVCPTHHVLLDYGAIRLDLSAIKTLLAHHLDAQHIDYHNREIYKGPR